MNDPAVLFYTSDFLTGVLDLTMEERGQYITLLCYQHQKGHFKEETIRLLVGNVSVNVLNKFEKDENGLLFNKRMDVEKDKRNSFVSSRKENGKKGGRPKKPLGKPLGKPSAKPLGKAKQNLPENDNDNDNENIYNNFLLDRGLLRGKIKEWLEYKKEKKQPYTEKGLSQLLSKIETSVLTYGENVVIELIDESIANSYQGIIWDKLKKMQPNLETLHQQEIFDGKPKEQDTEKLGELEKILKEFE